MPTPKLGMSVFALAAIRSCGDAFVAIAPRPRPSIAVGTRSALRTGLGPIQPRSVPDLPVSHGGASSRRASSSALRSATKPLVVCGPSGVGKGTIISKFMEREAENSNLPKFGFSVSHTTRQPRPGEIDGVHYHFVSREYMRDRIDAGDFFIEHAEVHGNLYGTSFQAIFDVSSDDSTNDSENSHGGGNNVRQQCLLDIDVEGVRSIKEFQSRQRRETKNGLALGEEGSTQLKLAKVESIDALPELDAKFIFIAPPSVDILRERLVGRGTETPETLERRFQNARAELEYGMAPGNFDAVVVNDDLERACAEFERVVEEMYGG